MAVDQEKAPSGRSTGWTRPLRLAGVGSVLVVLAGLRWRSDPATYSFGPGDAFGDSSMLGATGAGTAGAFAVGVGVLGVLTVLGLAYGGVAFGRFLAFVAASQAMVLGLVVPDIQALILTAYLLAFVVPPVLLGAKFRDGLRNPRVRWWLLAALGSVVTLGFVGDVLRIDTFVEFGEGIGGGFADVGARPLYLFLALALAVCWACVVVSSIRESGPGRVVSRSRAWVERWGVAATWVAALSPLPYVVSRLTWLTPWPMFVGDADLAEEPAMRLMGILLGLVAESCLWLTLGLIRPRGEVFPQWVPYVGGGAVPVMAAVIPGLSGAVLLTIAGRSLVQQCLFSSSADASAAWIVLLLPLWLWGPALGVATAAYWLRRRGAEPAA